MFEKSLVDLIRGLRSHKGDEAEYIQSALKECRSEIRSQDMDVKATALLKLIYLEMFGYDMAWAAFNVLEVMSSAKHAQKRVGYLGAVQSIRPDTDVLMLATNLLKKDLTSPLIPIMSLPLITLPHIITSSLALSVLTDLLPRLSHSQPVVRKKTIVTLYRLALVYPETLRAAWPKIKERMLDEQEDPSVTAATVNVVCELGWRRPKDFLSLAPRLFDLLIDGRNNWMAIKVIKLFAVLTPLEPRLVKKLVRPLTNLILSTTAMSLLYECINGIIQGGILDSGDGGLEGDEVASLCINKLRGMIVLEGDPNLKYVALLAFNKIVTSHPQLVSRQEDVILGCLDDPDISIRTQALELVSGMVSIDNLQQVVDRLVRQLSNAPIGPAKTEADSVLHRAIGIAESDSTDLEEKLVADKRGSDAPPLPDYYRQEVVQRILDMCTYNTYANIADFEWYIETLVHLVRLLPPVVTSASAKHSSIATRVGAELLNIAVRVKELRTETTRAAEKLILMSNRISVLPSADCGRDEVLKSAAWVVGEYANELGSPEDALDSLIHESNLALDAVTLSFYIQAAPKVFTQIAQRSSRDWNAARKTMTTLLLARVINFIEKLAAHPNLEVQERSVEYLELHRLLSEAVGAAQTESSDAPLLLTSALPALFTGMDLNPVAAGAQAKVPIPEDLDLETPINSNLVTILQESQIADAAEEEHDESEKFYNEPESTPVPQNNQPARFLEQEEAEPLSYQAPEDPATRVRKKAERRARNKDDPFYIPQEGDSSGISTPVHEILSKDGEQSFDVDSIPIIDLHIEDVGNPSVLVPESQKPKKKKKVIKRFAVTADETVGSKDVSSASNSLPRSLESAAMPVRPKKNLLSVDSSNLQAFSLDPDDQVDQLDIERRAAEEAEMAAAMKEVERLRLEMQRAAERIETAEGVDVEGTVVKKKKRRKAKEGVETENGDAAASQNAGKEEVVKKKKKKKKKPDPQQATSVQDE